MTHICKKKGFTLLEILIVVAVIAILSAIAIPSALNMLRKAQEAVALANCREAVFAGYRITLDEKFEGSLASSDFLDSPSNKALILSTAGIAGQIIDTSVSTQTAMVVYLQYIDGNSIVAIYDSSKSPSYFIQKFVSGTAPAYNYSAYSLLDASDILETISGRDKQTKALQALFLEENDGVYPLVSSEEKGILTSKGLSAAVANTVNWRPILSSSGELFLVASTAASDKSNPSGYMIYYADQYYYWYHYGIIKTSYVSDQSFDLSILDPSLTSPPSASGIWLCYQ
ncbi:MAG: prepilin-type N-terminal cleavage/methylation domain-containing protein [Clostridia bacterium]|nr:prepilin-type N-terminal cleavage/methylation domain-containing protein [Clostridia bacterium]